MISFESFSLSSSHETFRNSLRFNFRCKTTPVLSLLNSLTESSVTRHMGTHDFKRIPFQALGGKQRRTSVTSAEPASDWTAGPVVLAGMPAPPSFVCPILILDLSDGVSVMEMVYRIDKGRL